MILINGGFPAPLIEANWGDTIQVTVHNNITGPEEGTTLHWHGFLQQGTPWEDGVPAITQCPIAPGASFTYQFQATLYGTAWYHSHYSAQYGDGIVGPIVVYGPNEYPYDVDVGPVMLSDYYHTDYLTILERMLAPGGKPEVLSDNNLIQGKNSYDCAPIDRAQDHAACESDAPKAEFFFEPGKVHRLRLVNTGSEAVQHFSIDDHVLTVIAYDFIPIHAYQTKVVTLGVGQRADVLVTANAATGANAGNASFWMRSNIATCSTAKQPYAMAAVYYSGQSLSSSGSPPSTAVGTSTRGSGNSNIDVGRGGPESIPGSGSVPGSVPGSGGIGGAGGPGSFGGFSSTTFHRGSAPGSPPSTSTHFGGGSGNGVGGVGGIGNEGSSVPATANPDKPQTMGLMPTSQPWAAGTVGVPDPSSCANDDLSLTRPLYPIALPPPSWTHTFDIDVFVNASNVTLWKFDGVSFRGDYNAPTLLLASLGNSSTADWPVEWNGRNLYTNTSVRMIVNNPGPSQHPMHLHGSNFYVLHEGPGQWDGHTIISPENPMRRDVQLVRPNGHLVLQFDTNNPGVWPFHCHIAWHASGGFLTQFIVQPEKIEQMNVPSTMAQTCRDWAAWTGTHIPDQIDSGL